MEVRGICIIVVIIKGVFIVAGGSYCFVWFESRKCLDEQCGT